MLGALCLVAFWCLPWRSTAALCLVSSPCQGPQPQKGERGNFARNAFVTLMNIKFNLTLITCEIDYVRCINEQNSEHDEQLVSQIL